jgi:Ca2+-binding EF-hand superfamily protein
MRKILLTCLLLTTTCYAAQAQSEHGAGGGDTPHGRGGRLFISPMGEPFRGPEPQTMWFDGADTNHDGVVTEAEFTADAMRFFAMLDRGHDGEIDPDDIEYYETVLAPEIRVAGVDGGEAPRAGGGGGRRGGGGGGHRGGGGGGMRGGGGGGMRGGGGYGGGQSSDEGGSGSGGAAHASYGKQGAARYSYFDYPEPITVADTNFNRGVDPNEFRTAALARFDVLDKNHDGKIEKGELPHLDPPAAGWGGGGRRGGGGWHGRPAGGSQPDPSERPQRDDPTEDNQ